MATNNENTLQFDLSMNLNRLQNDLRQADKMIEDLKKRVEQSTEFKVDSKSIKKQTANMGDDVGKQLSNGINKGIKGVSFAPLVLTASAAIAGISSSVKSAVADITDAMTSTALLQVNYTRAFAGDESAWADIEEELDNINVIMQSNREQAVALRKEYDKYKQSVKDTKKTISEETKTTEKTKKAKEDINDTQEKITQGVYEEGTMEEGIITRLARRLGFHESMLKSIKNSLTTTEGVKSVVGGIVGELKHLIVNVFKFVGAFIKAYPVVAAFAAAITVAVLAFKAMVKIVKSIANMYLLLGKGIVALGKGLLSISTTTFNVLKKACGSISSSYDDALKAAYKWSAVSKGQLAKSLDSIKSSVDSVKAGLVAIAGPILNALAPVLDAITDKILILFNAVGKLLAMLGGQSSYTKAIKGATKYAEATSDAAEAAKDLTTGIDELNVLNTDSGSGSSSSSDGGYSYVEEAIEKKSISQIGDWINEQVANWNATELGEKIADYIGNGIKNALELIKTINWKQIGEKIGEFVSAVITPENMGNLGTLLVEAIMGAFDLANGFVSKLNEHKDELKASIVAFVTNAVKAFNENAESIADLITGLANIATTILEGITEGLTSDSNDNGVSDLQEALTTIFKDPEMWDAIGQALYAGWMVAKTVFEALGRAVFTNPGDLGDLANTANEKGYNGTYGQLKNGLVGNWNQDYYDSLYGTNGAKAPDYLKAGYEGSIRFTDNEGNSVLPITAMYEDDVAAIYNQTQYFKNGNIGVDENNPLEPDELREFLSDMTFGLFFNDKTATEAKELTKTCDETKATITAVNNDINKSNDATADNTEKNTLRKTLNTLTFGLLFRDENEANADSTDKSTSQQASAWQTFTDGLGLTMTAYADEMDGANQATFYYADGTEVNTNKAKTAWTTNTDSIKQAVSNTKTSVNKDTDAMNKNTVDKADDTQKKTSNSFLSMKTNIENAFKALAVVIKTPINSVIGFINKMASAAVEAVNTIIDAVNALSFDVPDWVPLIGGETYGFNLSKLTWTDIPTLAHGGVVSGGLFIAGEAGPEAVGAFGNKSGVMNTDQMADAVANGVYNAMMSAMRQGNGQSINVYLDGKQIESSVRNTAQSRGANIAVGGVLNYSYA